jgi:DNA-binding response OmpR family regulator
MAPLVPVSALKRSKDACVDTSLSESTARPHVVVVNSEPDFLIAVRELLEEEGYDVSTMHVDESPFEVIITVRPAVIVIDFVYQKPDGWNLLARLDEDDHARTIPLVATSTDELILEQIKTLSTHRPKKYVLVKPFDLDELLEAIAHLRNG